jgi:Ca-activated chloride channel family protein
MRWENPYILFLLLALPIFIIFVTISEKYRKRRFSKFADSRFYKFYLQQFSVFHWKLKNVLLLLACFFAILAAARPQWDKELEIVKKKGIDIVVCIDVSKSMDAEDIKPSRIQRAKDQLSYFIDQLRGDRIAIVAFAGYSFVQCPLTDDYDVAKLFLNLLDTNTIQTPGTDIGGAIEKSLNVFTKDQKNKVIVVISDGEDLSENAEKFAEKAAKQGAVIYALGVGSPEGSTIPIMNETGAIEYAKDDEGNIVLSKLDITTLTKIANLTDGKFYPITPRQSEILEIMKKINQTEKTNIESKRFSRYKDQFRYFVYFALLLLFLDLFIQTNKRVKKSRVIEDES